MRSGKLDATMYYMPFLRRFAPSMPLLLPLLRQGSGGGHTVACAGGRTHGRAKRLRGAARFVRFREACTARSALREHL